MLFACIKKHIVISSMKFLNHELISKMMKKSIQKFRDSLSQNERLKETWIPFNKMHSEYANSNC